MPAVLRAGEGRLLDVLRMNCRKAGCTSLSATDLEDASRSGSSVGSVVASHRRIMNIPRTVISGSTGLVD